MIDQLALFDEPDADVITWGGWTATGRYLGKCPTCKSVMRHEGKPVANAFPIVRTCCGRPVKLNQVFGSKSTRRCDARCMNAHGPNCECSCAGRNHGIYR